MTATTASSAVGRQQLSTVSRRDPDVSSRLIESTIDAACVRRTTPGSKNIAKGAAAAAVRASPSTAGRLANESTVCRIVREPGRDVPLVVSILVDFNPSKHLGVVVSIAMPFWAAAWTLGGRITTTIRLSALWLI